MNEKIDKIVIVDPGKNEVKVFSFTQKYELLKVFSFPSKSLQKINFSDIDYSSPLQFRVEFDDEKFLVGEGINKGYNFALTKNNFHHKLCVYTAVANTVESEGERIHLIIGYPSSDYVNEAQRKEYEDLIKGTGEVDITVNGESKKFVISSISVLPEGIAFRPRLRNANKTVHIIDIGGQNINYRQYDAIGNTLVSFSLDSAGINHLEAYVRNELRRYINAEMYSVEAIDILKAIKNGEIEGVDSINGFKSTAKFIEYTVNSFIENSVIEILLSKGVNLTQRGHLIIFTGGGSLTLRPYLEKTLVHNTGNMHFSDTAKWDNCISYVIKDLGNRARQAGTMQEAKTFSSKIIKQVEIKDFDEINNPFINKG